MTAKTDCLADTDQKRISKLWSNLFLACYGIGTNKKIHCCRYGVPKEVVGRDIKCPVASSAVDGF